MGYTLLLHVTGHNWEKAAILIQTPKEVTRRGYLLEVNGLTGDDEVLCQCLAASPSSEDGCHFRGFQGSRGEVSNGVWDRA